MSLNPMVTPNMVSRLIISEMCLESFPCQHECNITLTDGRKKRITLGGPSIDSLRKEIACEKICCAWPNSHFAYPSFEQRSAENILTGVFCNKSSFP